jgi:KipI family sensor histidine kinase inhibitor
MPTMFAGKDYQQKNTPIPLGEYTHIERVSESSVIIRVSEMSRTHPLTSALTLQARNLRVKHFLRHIQVNAPHWLLDHVIAYDSLLLAYNPLHTTFEAVLNYLNITMSEIYDGHPDPTISLDGQLHNVDVCYSINDKDHPNDMALVETITGCIARDLIDMHQLNEYQVFAIGFMPNFAYLGELPPTIRVARLAQPRHSVPAGAVAIADNQTAIYPSVSPGGWHIIGYTAFSFSSDLSKAIGPNDKVKFTAVDQESYCQQIERAGN